MLARRNSKDGTEDELLRHCAADGHILDFSESNSRDFMDFNEDIEAHSPYGLCSRNSIGSGIVDQGIGRSLTGALVSEIFPCAARFTSRLTIVNT